MTALSGGEQLDDEQSPQNPVLERPDAAGDVRRAPRSLEEIFPLRGEVTRGREMQETWRAFGAEMEGAVRSALDASRSPPEIAYAIGGIVHNYFRTRGVTLTSYELRRLVAELLTLRQRAEPAAPLVAFTAEPAGAETAWTGDEPGTPAPGVPDGVFEGPPSRLVDVTPRDSDAALAEAVTALVRGRLAASEGRFPRAAAVAAIDAALGELAQDPPERRDRLARLALSELCGMGPIDLIWADRSVRAVFVNGPAAIYIERNGVIEPSPARFRDQAHLSELVGRLVRRSSSGAVMLRLRDGGEGMVVFPPAAPEGPILVLRRGEPGNATFERLIAARTLDPPMVELLRIAAQCRLNMFVVGAEGSGKTALLAALARDLSRSRVVTLARHREFRWPQPSKVELGGTVGRSLCASSGCGHAAAAGSPGRRSGRTGRCAGVGRASVAWRPRHPGRARAAGDGRHVAHGDRSRRSPRSAGRRPAWCGGHGRLDRRADLRPRGRSVSSANDRAVFCRARAPSGPWRGAFEGAALTAATGRHIPSGVENPLRHKPISGTNRFEMRGILRVGILIGSSR